MESIKKSGYSPCTHIVLTNSDEYLDIVELESDNVDFNHEIIKVIV